MIIAIGLASFITTFLGGLFALKFKDKLHLILGFSAGAVIGVAFFDLIPEALELGGEKYSTDLILSLVALGFIIYMILDRVIISHGHSHETKTTGFHRGVIGASSISIHSLLDGIAIGVAFQVSNGVGLIVAMAVLIHNFCDGINTVSLILKSNNNRKQAVKWLIIDSLAPIVGIISTLFFTLSTETLGVLLALFAGFFLYIGASDLLPESQHDHETIWTTIVTILSVFLIYFIIKIAHI